MLEALFAQQGLSPIWRISEMLYIEYSPLVVRQRGGASNCIISSQQGVQQGNVLSSLLFVNTMHPALKAVESEYGDDAKLLAYVDDIHVIGSDVKALAAYNSLAVQLDNRCGLTMSAEKCKVLTISAVPSTTDWASYGITVVTTLNTLGYAITTNHVDAMAVADKRINGVAGRIEQLLQSQVLSAQEKLLMMRSIASHWSTYTLPFMATGNEQVSQSLARFDSAVSGNVIRALGLPPLSLPQITQLNLPLVFGGMGLGALSSLLRALALRISSLRRIINLKLGFIADILRDDLESAITEIASLLHINITATLPVSTSPPKTISCLRAAIAVLPTSATITRYCYEEISAALAVSFSDLDKARFGAISLPNAQAILHIRPYDFRLTLSDFEVKNYVALYLGAAFDNKFAGTTCMSCISRHGYVNGGPTSHCVGCP